MMNLLLVPLHLYSQPEENKRDLARLIARVYKRAEESNAGHKFYSISHCDGLTKAILTQSTAPKNLPTNLIGPLARLIGKQLEDIIEKRGECIHTAYMFIKRDQGHYILRDVMQTVLYRMNVPLKVYTSSDIIRQTAQ